MTAQQLKNSILQMAVQGKLVPQDLNDEPASVLIQKIRDEKEQMIKDGKIKKEKNPSFIFRSDDGLFYEKVGNKEPVCIEDEIPFEIPNSWEWCRLKTIVNVVSARRVHQSDWRTEGIPFYRAREIAKLADNGFVDNELFISPDLYEEYKKSGVPHVNDLMVTAVGTLGKTYVVQEDDQFYYKDASVICFENFGQLNPYYIQLIMQSPFMQSSIKQSSSGTTVGTITIIKANEYLIPLPPRLEQDRICGKYNVLNPLLDKYYDEYDLYDSLNLDFPNQLKDSILQYAVQGKLVSQDTNDEPASALIEKIHDEKEQLIKNGKIKRDKHESVIYRRDESFYEITDGKEQCINDEIPFEIPESWEWIRLNQIVYNHGQKKPNESFCYIDIGSIDNVNHCLNEEESIVEATNAPSRARKIVEKGDIIYSTVRPYLHNMCIINKEFSHELIASTGFAVLSCYSGLLNEYLFYYMLSPIFDSYVNDLDNSKGVAYPAINDKRLYNALIAIPPINEQYRIVDKINEIFLVMK